MEVDVCANLLKLVVAVTNFSVLNEVITIMIPYNAQHEAARYGCCIFVCGSCTPAAVKYQVSVYTCHKVMRVLNLAIFRPFAKISSRN